MAASLEAREEPISPQGDWTRRYAPLLALAIALVLALTVLPSALNLPQTNPTETAEYAPVPPQDKNNPPPGGDISNLGLASSAGEQVPNGPSGDSGPVGPLTGGTGSVPSKFNCVNGHQTEDPLSPPCVAYYQGDNGGATYQGVTRDEVRVVVYTDGNGCYSYTDEPNSAGLGAQPTRPTDVFYDLDKDASNSASDPSQPENGNATSPAAILVPALRDLDHYLNMRYQMYGRHLHMWLMYSRTAASCPWTPSERRSDAAEIFKTINPFAVINFAPASNEAFNTALAKDGIVSFSSAHADDMGHKASFFQQYPGYLWSFAPSFELTVDMYSNFICARVAPYPVSYAGDQFNPAQRYNGTKRVYGLIESQDPGFPDHTAFAKSLAQQLNTQCGITIKDTATFKNDGVDILETGAVNPSYARTQMTNFQTEGITTIIWGGGEEDYFSKQAASANYYPEWILAGDRHIEGGTNPTAQNAQEWTHAIAITAVTRYLPTSQSECYSAYVQGGGTGTASSDDAGHACGDYTDLREMITGIQVGGAHLTKDSVDKGYHAIPKRPSSDPTTPACFYLAADYTCTKDATAVWFDPSAFDPNGNQGCWHMFENGKRYTLGQFTQIDFAKQVDPRDVCNAYGGG